MISYTYITFSFQNDLKPPHTHSAPKCLGMTSKSNRWLTGSSIRFWAVSIVLNDDNRPEPAVDQGLGFEVAPYWDVDHRRPLYSHH